MQLVCSKCGVETKDPDNLHCRKILVEDIKKLLLNGDLKGAEILVTQSQFDEKWDRWKWDMFERLSSDLKNQLEAKKLWVENQRAQENDKKNNEKIIPFFNKAKGYISLKEYRSAEIYILDSQMNNPNLPLWQKYVTNLRHSIPLNSQLPIIFTPRNDWEGVENMKSTVNLDFLVHITDIQNIDSIKKNKGLFSRQALLKYNIKPIKYASNRLSWSIDEQKNLSDYIHLSIQKSPMMFVSGVRPVTLRIDSRFIYAQETKFSDKNSTDYNANIGSTYEDFQRINFYIAKTRWNNEEEKKLFQAEILVRHYIPIEFIKF